MPYTPDPTNVAQPANTGVAASTAAAEFRALKLYIRDTILAPLLLKRNYTDLTFFGNGNFSTGNLNVQLVCTAQQGFQVSASGGYQASGYIGIGLKVGPSMSIGWSASSGTVFIVADAATLNGESGNLTFQGIDSAMRTVTVTNSRVKEGDLILMHLISGTQQLYRFDVVEVGAGYFKFQYQGLGFLPLTQTVGFAILSRS